jgi:hypothetical protein
MASQFVFVSTDGGKVKATDRDLIRSRCMQGKNKRQNSRRSLQAARQAALSAQSKDSLESKARRETVAFSDQPSAPTGKGAHGPWKPTRRANSHKLPAPISVSQSTIDYLQRHFEPKLGSDLVRFIRRDAAIYPQEFLFTCQSPKP